MESLVGIPATKAALLDRLVNQLRDVPGLAAIVLGGSYARGTQHAASDLDLGLYYHEDRSFSVADIRQIANGISSDGPVVVTDFYEWGAWVNGGAWIRTTRGKVDLLYRNLDQVWRTIRDAQQGVTHHDYDQQPAYGFYSVIYLAETQICIPLYDPGGLIADLKRAVEVYPPELKAKIVGDSLWGAEFSLIHARDFAARADVYNTAGCLTRVAANLTQALFAINERYFISDKRVMETMAAFPILPAGYAEELTHILACPSGTVEALAASVRDLERVWKSVTALPGVDYRPSFHL